MPPAKRTGGSVKHPNSLANLSPAPPAPRGNQRATKSGADGAKARELREMHFAELIEEYPGENERSLRLYARCLARLECYAEYHEQAGEIRNRRTGEIRASSPMETRLSAQAFAWQEKLDERKKTHGEPPLSILERQLRGLPAPGND